MAYKRKNVEQSVEPEQPVHQCQACGSGDVRIVRPLPSTTYDGTTPDGRTYKTVIRRMIHCRSCGSNGVAFEYE
ncbi:MAG: hypothetical protein ACRYGG_21060 [Janthinobacterium lividum]